MIKRILALILGIIVLIGIIIWLNGFDDYRACLNDPDRDNNNCLEEYLMKSPPIQEANDIEQACNETDSECLLKIGQKAIEQKITE